MEPFLQPRDKLNKQSDLKAKIDPKIINVFDNELDNNEITVLLKGFKFTPTPKPKLAELQTDIQKFNRRLQPREFFGSDNKTKNPLQRINLFSHLQEREIKN